MSFDLTEIKIGKDTKTTILEKYGPPSTKSLFPGENGAERWYYTHRRLTETTLKGRHSALHQTIEFVFNRTGVVVQIKTISGEKEIRVQSKYTKEKGYKTSLFKELFGNIGKFDQIPIG